MGADRRIIFGGGLWHTTGTLKSSVVETTALHKFGRECRLTKTCTRIPAMRVPTLTMTTRMTNLEATSVWEKSRDLQTGTTVAAVGVMMKTTSPLKSCPLNKLFSTW